MQAAPGRVVAAGTWVVLRNIVVEAFHIVEHKAAAELGQDRHLDCTLGRHRHLDYKYVAGNLAGLRIGSLTHLEGVARERRMRIVYTRLSMDCEKQTLTPTSIWML